MTIIGNIISVLAVFMFMVDMCVIDGNPVFACVSMIISGVWLVAWGYAQEEKIRKGRR